MALCLSPREVAAEDAALASFQKEIILAKERYRDIVARSSALSLSLDAQASGSPSAREVVPARRDTVIPAPAKADSRSKHSGMIGKPTPLSDGEALYKVAVSDNKIVLKEAVDIGLANNLAVRAAEKKADAARSKLTEARRALFPTVQGVYERNGGKASASDTIPGGRIFRGKNYKINATQPLFYGGELVLTVKQAEASWKSSQAEYQKLKNDAVREIKTAYYGVVKAEYNAEYQEKLRFEVDALHKRLVEERREKLISEIDFLNAESQTAQVFFQTEAAKNDLLSARLLLNHAAGLASDRPFPVDLRLTFSKIDPNLDEVTARALEKNPDIRVKSLLLEAAGYGVRIFTAKKLPHFDLRGSYGMLGEVFKDTAALEGSGSLPPGADNADLDTEKEWFFGVQGSMPLGPNSVEYSRVKHVYGPTIISLHGSEDWSHKVTFNLFDKLAEITDEKSAEAAFLQARADYDKAKNDLVVQLRDSVYNLRKALIQIDLATAKVKYQEKQNAVSGYLLSMQETAPAGVIEGMIEQAQNRFSFIQAIADYHVAVADLNSAIGDADYFEDPA
ncbi:MAG: TolC family protein [Candidatus Omnitrophica bacterium]|nr:TolC family protein [Candidatus Omnitrophota bacterium]